MAVPSDGFTVNYGWDLPSVGGDIGAWGGILNSVFGEDSAVAPLILGIDGVIAAIQADLDLSEARLDDLLTQITVLESDTVPSFYAKVVPSIGQTVQNNIFTKLVWATELFDEGDVHTGSEDKLVIPVGGEGAWMVRVHITADPYNDSDNSRSWELQIRRGVSGAIADARTPHQNDGFSSDSGDISLTAEVLVEVTAAQIAAGDNFFEAWVRHFQPSSENPTSASFSSTASKMYFEAARVAPPAEVAA